MRRFDVMVLGGGSAGFAAARRACKLEASVALVEQGILGGECPNTACVPFKALLRSAEVMVAAQRAREFGVRLDQPQADWPAVRKRMFGIIGRAEGDRPTEARLREQGIAVFRGHGQFIAPDVIQVGEERLTAPRTILTTGSADTVPPIGGLTETGFLTHKEAIDLETLPQSLAIVGAGPVGVECAQIFAPLGVDVTLLSSSPLPLPREDHAISRLLLHCLRSEGIRVETGVRVERVEPKSGLKVLTFTDGRHCQQLAAAEILIATGHHPVVAGVGLERAGVERGGRGVTTDAGLRTTAECVWAAGDVTGVALFTHVASYQGKLAAENALGGKWRTDYRVIPRVTFCRPEVASVGLTEEQCQAQDLHYRALSLPFTRIEKSLVESETAGMAKLLCEPGTGHILGAHVLGARAGELIHEIAAAMQNQVPARGIGSTIHAFPTFSEIWEAVAWQLE